jgi:transcriptional regulator with XRE-family HTH domain
VPPKPKARPAPKIRLASATKDLLRWRKKAGLTQRQVAERIAVRTGMSRRWYRHIERGRRPVTPQALAAILEVLSA